MNDREQSRLDAWRWLASAEGDALRAKVKDWIAPLPAQVTALRKEFSQEVVHAALQWASGRAKAIAKFGELGSHLWSDPEGVEMASGPLPAAWKATRFARASRQNSGTVLDVCCGIGADAIALREAGLAVTCVDLDPLRAWMAEQNTQCPSIVMDARALATDEAFWRAGLGKDVTALHIDPARRITIGSGGASRSRIWKFADVEPGPEAIRALLERCPDAGIKLSPGLNFAEVREQLVEPSNLSGQSQVEFISQRGKLVQGVVWTGKLARGMDEMADSSPAPRRATLLTSAGNWSIFGEADRPQNLEVLPLSRYFFEVDDAIERAELLGALTQLSARGTPSVPLALAHPKLGLFVARENYSTLPILDASVSPWLTPFELLAEMPWNERKVEERLKQLGAGIVEVKTRDGLVNPDDLQTKFSRKRNVAKMSIQNERNEQKKNFASGKNPLFGAERLSNFTQHVGEVPQFSPRPLVLFVLRFGQSPRALVARRLVADV